MSELKALLMTSVLDSIPLTQYFPLNYHDNKSITELLIIAKYLNNCGKGILEHNNKLYYYRTYVPLPLPDGKDNQTDSLSQSYSDYFIYSLDCNKKKFFFLIYCGLNYKQKDIDNLTNDIFEIFDKGAFDGHELKKTSRDEINLIFENYQKLSLKIENNQILNNNQYFINYNNKTNSNNSTPKKRIDSRIIIPKIKKNSKTFGEVSADIDDFTSINNTNSNISLMFRYDFNNETFLRENKEMKKIKYLNLLFFFILLLIMIAISTLFIIL